jgi:hypothetical protein
MKGFDIKLFRVFAALLVGLMLIMPVFAQSGEGVTVGGDGFNEVAIAVIVLAAFIIGLFGGIGGMLAVLNWLTSNEKIMTLLENRYNAASNGTKEIVGTLDKALDVIHSISKGYLPEIVLEAVDKVDDFVEEISDGKPFASKPHEASSDDDIGRVIGSVG